VTILPGTTFKNRSCRLYVYHVLHYLIIGHIPAYRPTRPVIAGIQPSLIVCGFNWCVCVCACVCACVTVAAEK
jgi:hypothetical protein